MKIGISKLVITPEKPVPLAGFAFRKNAYEEVSEDIHARTIYFHDKNFELVLVSADLIWFGKDIVEKIRGVCREKYGLKPEQVLLHATHSHSGPQTGTEFTPSLGLADEAYMSFLANKVIEGIALAKSNKEEVEAYICKTTWNLGINRRKKVDDRVEMAPNDKGIKDDILTFIYFYTKGTNNMKAVICHGTCHPNISAENKISAEYTGIAMSKIENYLGNQTAALFLQGFTGNIRPNIQKQGKFLRGTAKEVNEAAEYLYGIFLETIKKDKIELKLNNLILKEETIKVPLNKVPDEVLLISMIGNEDITGEWSRFLLEDKSRLCPYKDLIISCVRLGKELSFIFINGEVVNEYAMYAQSVSSSKVLSVGYTNGMIGYLPTEQQINEGGYEPDESAYYFALPGKYDKELESIFKKKIKELLNEMGDK